jgi:branched-chain amino acid transport system ATP-binding protein
MRPELIICDEVFSGLSMSEITSLIPLLEKLRMQGITMIMIEHRLRELFRLADEVIAMSFGVKIAEGNPEKVMATPEVREAYLGSETAR